MTHVILAVAYEKDGGDYSNDYVDVDLEIIDEEALDNINKLMKDYFIKEWVDNPDFSDTRSWKEGQAALLEYRPFIVKPVRLVESWQLVRTNVAH